MKKSLFNKLAAPSKADAHQELAAVAVGNGKVNEDGSIRKLDVKAGDKILFGKYSGSEVKLDGEEHLIMREDDILAIILK